MIKITDWNETYIGHFSQQRKWLRKTWQLTHNTNWHKSIKFNHTENGEEVIQYEHSNATSAFVHHIQIDTIQWLTVPRSRYLRSLASLCLSVSQSVCQINAYLN